MVLSGLNACVLLEEEVRQDWRGASLVEHSEQSIHQLKVGSRSFFIPVHSSKLNSQAS
jgi:hypothetical protein